MKSTERLSGQRLLAARRAAGLTQVQLAAKLGVTAVCICYLELGHRQPSIPMLCRLADFFGVSTDHLLGRGPELK